MKSWKTPTPEMVDKAIASMVHLEQQRYFFERLDNPNWLAPLRKKGFFVNPPVSRRDDLRGTIEFQQWPSIKYLSRMAAHEPALVSQIMSEIPESDNPYVVQAFLEAAMSMAPEIADRLTPQIVKMVRSPYLFRAHQIGDVATHLARGGKLKSAISLLRAAFEIVPDPRPVPEGLKTLNPNYRHEARTRLASYEYEGILQRNGPELVKLIGAPYVSILCDLLDRALELEERRQGHGAIEDYSYIWLPSMETGETTDSPKRLLTRATLQSADVLSSQGPEQLAKMREVLAKRRFKVFQRIELELIKRHLGFAGNAPANALTDKTIFDDIGLRYEYDALAKKAFGTLNVTEQDQILQWIQQGLNRDRLVENGYSEEQADNAIDHWRLERLTPIKDSLPSAWSERYEALEAKFGEQPQDRRRMRGGAYAISSKSPKPAEDLEKMAVTDVIDYLKKWHPGTDESPSPFAPSEVGLGAVLTSVIAKTPAEFSKEISNFKEVDPTYVRAAIQGLESAIREHRAFDWKTVLDLCAWVCSQPVKISDRTGSHWTKDPDWSGTRAAMVGLIEQGFKEKAIPFELRESVWKVIKSLAEQSNSDGLDYRDPDSQSKDIWSYSVNRTQPRATRLVFQYIEWCRDSRSGIEFSLAGVPEAESLLSRHLDPSVGPSLDIRLIYGEMLPFLTSIDRDWVEQNKSKIFPEEADKKALLDVAWVAYLVANRAYKDVFEAVQALYWSAVRNMGVQRQVGVGNMMYNPNENLGHHFMQLYWWGCVGLEDHGILDEFLKRSDDELLGRMITYLGRSLKETTDKIPDDTLNRLKNLWDRCLIPTQGSPLIRTLAAFGWWFNSNFFDDEWALERLQRTLELSKGAIEPKLGTLARLARLAATFPRVVSACTQLIVNADMENVVLWVDDLKSILGTVLKSSDSEAIRIGRQIIHNLGTHGYHEYRDLLA